MGKISSDFILCHLLLLGRRCFHHWSPTILSLHVLKLPVERLCFRLYLPPPCPSLSVTSVHCGENSVSCLSVCGGPDLAMVASVDKVPSLLDRVSQARIVMAFHSPLPQHQIFVFPVGVVSSAYTNNATAVYLRLFKNSGN